MRLERRSVSQLMLTSSVCVCVVWCGACVCGVVWCVCVCVCVVWCGVAGACARARVCVCVCVLYNTVRPVNHTESSQNRSEEYNVDFYLR